jgi:undecaprenyl-diphosphatase
VEAAFNSPYITGLFLVGTAALLFIAEMVGKRSRTLAFLKWQDALWIGLLQAVAIFPGISRSGSTIAGGQLRNFQRPSAARFSFLMSIPIMLAAGIVSLKDLFQVPGFFSFLPLVLIGFITSGVVGYLSIHFLLRFLNKRSLLIFSLYCLLLGIFTILKGNA